MTKWLVAVALTSCLACEKKPKDDGIGCAPGVQDHYVKTGQLELAEYCARIAALKEKR
jgi:hypothetical protein